MRAKPMSKQKNNTTQGFYRDSNWESGLYRRNKTSKNKKGKEKYIYYYRRMVDGKRKTISLKTGNLTTAMALAAEKNKSVEDKGLTIEEALNNKKRLFRDIADEDIMLRQITEATKRRYGAMLKNFYFIAESILGRPTLYIDDIDNKFLTEFVKKRLTLPVSPNGHKNSKTKVGASIKTVSGIKAEQYAQRAGLLSET